MRFPEKRSNDVDRGQLDERVGWAVIGLIVGCAALILWLPVLKQLVG
jgi:hypothetical protein